MDMSEQQRRDLAPRIQERRESLYGTKRAAYQEAGVNPMTWDRAEAGETVRDDILRRIVRALWPDSDGDWRRVLDPSVGSAASQEDDGEISPELRALIRATVEEVLAAEHSAEARKSS